MKAEWIFGIMITRTFKGSDTLKFSRFAYKKLLHPPGKAVVLIDMIAIPLVVIALVFLSPMNPVSIIAYILSSYALIITFMNSSAKWFLFPMIQ